MSNLTQRILTAVVLLALFIPALAMSTPWPFLLLTLLLVGAAGWEWSRLIGWSGWRAWASGVLCAVGAVVLPFLWETDRLSRLLGWRSVLAWQFVCWCAVCLLWVGGGAWLLWRGVARWPALPQWLRWGFGMAILAAAWAALIMAYGRGVNYLLSVLALVWVADIGAYAFGRTLGGKLTGGRKLAPSISPGKTWEGAVGGFICVLLLGAVWVGLEPHSHRPSLYTILWLRGPIWFVAGLALLTAMSVIGDLTESLVKRAAGAKDSSQLLPGHGGVLDRIDALLPVLPLAVLLVTYLPPLLELLSRSAG
ncbi:MAG: phosphatidate cytidylyltransferase [Betaproteobacteria bacterium]|nr:phosphatidate cytidylyltransferase [Betaproteobacteria bacterium]MCL2886961.1 phosphatidate cytidylyltransferase [Betaproteobacteria bacterium]